mmetsp:Transcript_115139/g.326198  ORF Transcript_115139/g.326198 Transcript_115139/m.326198 type:complete len:233 (-) Transcript_115139:1930-2628(-)
MMMTPAARRAATYPRPSPVWTVGPPRTCHGTRRTFQLTGHTATTWAERRRWQRVRRTGRRVTPGSACRPGRRTSPKRSRRSRRATRRRKRRRGRRKSQGRRPLGGGVAATPCSGRRRGCPKCRRSHRAARRCIAMGSAARACGTGSRRDATGGRNAVIAICAQRGKSRRGRSTNWRRCAQVIRPMLPKSVPPVTLPRSRPRRTRWRRPRPATPQPRRSLLRHCHLMGQRSMA